MALAIFRSIEGYILILQGKVHEHVGGHLVESLDGFLLAVVFIIFSIGFGKLFIPDSRVFKNIQISWLQPKNFMELKHTLWGAILTTLVVTFATFIVRNVGSLQWQHLIVPLSIALLAFASKMLKDHK